MPPPRSDELLPAFESFVTGIRFYMSNPGMRVAWQLSSGHFGREFRGFVDSILRDTAIAPVPDAYGEWKRLVSEIKAWENQRNVARARIKWQFTTEKARDKLARTYPDTSKESKSL